MGIVAQHSITTFTSPVNATSPIDANTVRGNDNTIKTAYDAHDADTGIHLQNTAVASRPAASTAGQMWLTSDTGAVYLYYDTGSAWVEANYLHQATTGVVTITSTTTPQLTVAYDGSNYVTVAVSSAGAVTFDAVGASHAFTFSDAVTCTSSLDVTGAFAVNTSKFTVAASNGNTVVAGTLGVTGVATFTAQPIASTLTASQAVFTDGSKGLVSNAITGTGNVVMSASPTLTGTVTTAAITASGLFKGSAGILMTGNTYTRVESTSGGGVPAGSAGVGLEFVISSNVAVILAYDRTGSAPAPLSITASSLQLPTGYTAGALTQQGYVIMKDSGGTDRKFMVGT